MRGQPACPRTEHPTPLPGAPSARPGSPAAALCGWSKPARMCIIAALTEIAPGARAW